MDSMTDQERRIAAGSLVVLGLTLALCAAAAATVGFEHMAARDAGVCGPLVRHCGSCHVAVGLITGALAVMTAAAQICRPRGEPAAPCPR